MRSSPRGLLAFAFLSGLTSLVYEIVWAKGLSLYIGGTALAQTAVLAAYLGGMALGNALLGRQADESPEPLGLYARLELWLGLAGLASPVLLTLLDRSLGAIAAAGGAPELLMAAGLSGAAVLVAAPAALVGGMLPSLARARAGDFRTAASRLYGANCFGAFAGALIAGFALIPRLGLDGTFRATALLDLTVGLLALWSAGGEPRTSPKEESAAPPAAPLPLVWAALCAYLAGSATLLYETSWTRLLSLVLGSSAYSFSVMLAAVIGGIGLGGWLVSARRLKRVEPARLLGTCQLAAALAAGLAIPLYERLPFLFVALKGWAGHGPYAFSRFEAAKLGLAILVTLAPATFLGMSLPLAASLAPQGAGTGRRLGAIFAASALGNVLGALAGLTLMPALGISGLVRAGMLVNALVGLFLLRPRAAPAAVVAGALLAAGRLAGWDPVSTSYGVFRAGPDALRSTMSEFRRMWSKDLTLLYHKDDRNATITVFQHKDGAKSLQVNGKTDASNGRDMRTQAIIGHLPLLLKPDAREVLLIGWGSGMTAGAVLRHPIERLDAVELSPAVIGASNHFIVENDGAIDDPRLDLHLEDAKTFLRRRDRSYDMIISEPSNPWMAGVGNLFTTEFYRQAKTRLNPDGLMVQWFHLYEMDDETAALIFRTFSAEFPHVTLWKLLNRDLIMIGSVEPLILDFDAMQERFENPAVSRSLKRVGLLTLTTVLAAQSAGSATVRVLARQGPFNRDRFPLLEYRAPKAQFRRDVAAAPDALDDRTDPVLRKKLILAGYLERRGAPLTRLEFMDLLSDMQAASGGEAYRAWAEEWTKRFPRDAQAYLALHTYARKAGRPEQARAALKKAASLAPRDEGIQGAWKRTLEDEKARAAARGS